MSLFSGPQDIPLVYCFFYVIFVPLRWIYYRFKKWHYYLLVTVPFEALLINQPKHRFDYTLKAFFCNDRTFATTQTQSSWLIFFCTLEMKSFSWFAFPLQRYACFCNYMYMSRCKLTYRLGCVLYCGLFAGTIGMGAYCLALQPGF